MSNVYHRVKLDLEIYRTQSLEIAKDLGYPNEILDKINAAKTETEITRIFTTARNSET